jgi:hypothetical protein
VTNTLKRGLTVRFIDGSSMNVSFPAQSDDQYVRKLLVGEVIKNRVLMVESDGAVHFIPFENIKQITVSPAPVEGIPGVIRGARISN